MISNRKALAIIAALVGAFGVAATTMIVATAWISGLI
jgi:hypothetical protein